MSHSDFKSVYEQVNGLLQMLKKAPIEPQVGSIDFIEQVSHLKNEYLKIIKESVPAYRNLEEHLIPDMGLNLILTHLKQEC